MRPYIYGERDGIHIIDLLQTEQLLAEARRFAAEVASKGGTVLFVGTKKQARDSVKEWAERCGMPYVNQRWLGGLLTNFHTMSARIDRLHELTELKEDGQLDLLPTKERMSTEAELAKLEYNLGGVAGHEAAAAGGADHRPEDRGDRACARPSGCGSRSSGSSTRTSTRCRSTIPIPGNDDSIRSCELVIRTIGEAVYEAAHAWREAEAKRQAEEEERRRREEEERAAPRGRGASRARRPRRRPQGGRRRGRGAAEAAPAEAGQEPSS